MGSSDDREAKELDWSSGRDDRQQLIALVQGLHAASFFR